MPVNTSLDPDDWDELRAHAHRMLDDMIDYLATCAGTSGLAAHSGLTCASVFMRRCRATPEPLHDIYAEFDRSIAPYATGNVHPGFMGWVHGGGNASGMLAEMLAGGAQRQSRRTRPHADRGRAADPGVDA